MTPIGRKKRCLFVAVLVLVPYLLVEAAATARGWFGWWDHSFTLTEDTRDAIVFDAVRGYRLTANTARTVRITDGRVEYFGVFRGNNQGFPDRDDFDPARPPGGGPRLAVFGDSFTHAHYLGQNWPDRAEDITREAGEPVRFLNFALSYTGLANWWSILTRVVDAEGYEVDGVVFAVWETNLLRSFTMCMPPDADRPYAPLLFGRCPTWDPDSFPATEAAARPYLDDRMKQYLLPRDEFERALQGEWPAPAPRHFRPVVLTTVYRAVRSLAPRPEEASGEQEGPFEPGRSRLIADMRRALERRGLPALVVHLPSREALLGRSPASRLHHEKARLFAEDLGAAFLDGREAFAGLSAREVRAHFYPHDGHWNQKGSDRFAAFVVRNLAWTKAARPSPTASTGRKAARSPGAGNRS